MTAAFDDDDMTDDVTDGEAAALELLREIRDMFREIKQSQAEVNERLKLLENPTGLRL